MKIGFVSVPVVGHLNPMTALARRLQSRGHEVVFIGVPDVEPFARAGGLQFAPYCEREYPAGSIARLYAPVAKLHGLDVTRWSISERLCGLFSAASRQLPHTLVQTGVEALVIDTIHAFVELVPGHAARACVERSPDRSLRNDPARVFQLAAQNHRRCPHQESGRGQGGRRALCADRATRDGLCREERPANRLE